MKLIPASRALATIRAEVVSSVGPPNIMVPRQIGEIFRPLRPSWRYCMGFFLLVGRHCERSEAIHRATKQVWIVSSLSLLAMTWKESSLTLQYLEHTARHRDTAFVDGHLGRDEDQAAGRAHHMRLRQQNLADLAGFDKMRVWLHGRPPLLARHEAGGHAAGAVGKRHQYAALHQAAAIVMLVLGDERELRLAVDDPFPQRSDQVQEAGCFHDGPAVGFELVRGPVRHVCVPVPPDGHPLEGISAAAGLW